MGLGETKTATQSLADEEVELIAAELDREVTIKHAAEEDARARGLRGRRRRSRAAAAGRHDHGPRRPRQDDAARRDPRDLGRRDRGRRDHAAHRRLPGRPRRPQDHVPRHARPRGVHRDARPRREGHGHRRARRRRRRRRHAADARVDLARARGRGADRRRGQQDRPARCEPDRVRNELAAEGLQPEDWGGQTQYAEVSAKQKQNLDDLLEKHPARRRRRAATRRANPKAEASGPIIESRLDVGRGPVATLLVQRGTLHVGDAVVAGDAWGKVRALYNYTRREGQGGRAGRPGRDRRLRQAAACRRARPCRRERARRRASSPRRAASGCAASSWRPSAAGAPRLEDLFAEHAGGRRPGAQPRPQGRRRSARSRRLCPS